jgi:parallel beta-helix repeat protein
MRCANKTKSVRLVLRLTVGLMMGLFVLGLSNAQNVEGFDLHGGGCWQAKPVTTCGITLQDGCYELTGNLTCNQDPAITITGPANLNLGGNILSGGGKDCIMITGDGGAKVWNGTVADCKDGIRIKSSHNKIISVTSRNNDRRGFRIDGDGANYNLLKNCLATENERQGFKIEDGASYNRVTGGSATDNGFHGINIDGGNGNGIYFSTVSGNCRDGIEIVGKKNLVFYNHVEDNANQKKCDTDGNYSPWAYAGIDVGDEVSVSENNKIEYNYACGNQGCTGSESEQCDAHERNFWDEYVDIDGNHVLTNEWKNNTVCPEYSPSPEVE